MLAKTAIWPIHALTCIAALCLASVGNAQVQTWHDVGEIGGPILWVVGLGSSLVQDGKEGPNHAARTFDGMLVAGGTAELLKHVVREQRPYDTGFDSFPSEHATLSFAVAAAQAYYHPKQATFWYGAATVVAVARVLGHDHYVQDVVVGSGLGYFAGRLSVTSGHGWVVAPLFANHRPGLMVSFSKSF